MHILQWGWPFPWKISAKCHLSYFPSPRLSWFSSHGHSEQGSHSWKQLRSQKPVLGHGQLSLSEFWHPNKYGDREWFLVARLQTTDRWAPGCYPDLLEGLSSRDPWLWLGAGTGYNLRDLPLGGVECVLCVWVWCSLELFTNIPALLSSKHTVGLCVPSILKYRVALRLAAANEISSGQKLTASVCITTSYFPL